MEKYITDDKTAIDYELIGDLYYPCLIATKRISIGKFGELRKTYLKTNHKIIYCNLLTSGKLNGHLSEVDILACEREARIIKEMTQAHGITEQLKEDDMLKWVGLMNNIKNCAEEIVLREVVYS